MLVIIFRPEDSILHHSESRGWGKQREKPHPMIGKIKLLTEHSFVLLLVAVKNVY